MRIAIAVLFLLACGKREESKPEIATPPKPVCEPGKTMCAGDNVFKCLPNGQRGDLVERCNARCAAGKCVDTCAIRDVELVYVVDNQHNLASFDPKKLPDDPFHPIAKLSCETKETPFSMGVDRLGIAWVLYRSGMLYRVSIIDGKCMPGTRPKGPSLFGMGFVSDGPNANTEKLFVAQFEGRQLGTIDVSKHEPAWQLRGWLPDGHNPELSGTGAGKLYGFFPADGGFVQEIDPATAKLVGTRMNVGAPTGHIGGWAFAHWGGNFYVFVTIDGNSMVYELDGKTGESKRVRENLPSPIVGAGVSTCAPLLESVAP